MTKYFSARTIRTPRRFLVIARFAFFLGVISLSSLLAQTGEQQLLDKAKDPQTIGSASRSTDAFLQLAETVGQSEPAKRLVEYTLQNGGSASERYWAIVDFNQPSKNRRFYVFDTETKKVDTYYVSHGRGSEGAADDGMADVFSNTPHSNSSSLGIYRALQEYVGKHGRSMRLEGLEPTNSRALERAIVLHKANYVSENVIRATGRLGRSQGCFAVEPSVGDDLVDKLKDGAYIIAWKA